VKALRALALVGTLLFAASGRSAPVVLRLATVAPDGSAWAREFKAFARDVAMHTNGEVQIKWYWGAIAGDELEVEDRMARGQIDGTASGGGLCTKFSPTQRAARTQDLLASHQEATWLARQLNDTLEQEFLQHGMVYLGGPVIGTELVWSRDPIHTVEELARHRLWRWDVDRTAIALSRAAGLTIVPKSLQDILHSYENGELDSFLSIPSTMLAFQLLPKVRYVQDWAHGYLIGCLIVAQRSFDRLSFEQQRIVRSDGNKYIRRVDDVALDIDTRLLSGMLQQQGIVVQHAPEEMKQKLLAAMHDAHKKVSDPQISDEIVRHLRELVAEHRKSGAPPRP
jgi:TRAP-type C4-dicarboxylate transport system substrate-binding protein